MRIVLLGPPGTGKGSLALLCKTHLGPSHLSTGEIFRQEIARRSSLGRRVARYVASGRLVPDTLVVEVMASRLAPQVLSKGFVLDGFPRTAGQAAGLDRALARLQHPLDGAVYLDSPRGVLVRRLTGRRVCAKCGANYHIRTMRPKQPNRCDRCDGPLITRKDDEPRTIRKRLEIDHRAAKPLLDYYRRRGFLYRVDGAGHIETVFRRAIKLFQKQGWLTTNDRAQDQKRTRTHAGRGSGRR